MGRTNFFAFSAGEEHTSRRLAVDDDIDPERHQFSAALPPATGEELQIHIQNFPLHYALVNDQFISISQTIRDAHAVDPSSISKQDPSGYRPIFIAAMKNNLPAVRTLLKLGAAPDVSCRRNSTNKTALEVSIDHMRSTREFCETLLGEWDGYPEDALLTQALLKRAIGQLAGSESDAQYATRSKFGCTCGLCIGGWLSARMKFRLHCEPFPPCPAPPALRQVTNPAWPTGVSEVTHDGMWINQPTFVARQPLAQDSFIMFDLDFIPPHLRGEVYKTFYKGYGVLFSAVAHVLKRCSPADPTVPDARTIAAELNSNNTFDVQGAQFYFRKGGRVEYALDHIMHTAMEQSKLGDETFEELHDSDDGWMDLPECVNDLDFELVRRKLGLSDKQQWGPYRCGEEDEMDEDDSEDEDGDVGMW